MMLLRLYESKRASKIAQVLAQRVDYLEYPTTKFCSIYTAGTGTKSPLIMCGLSTLLFFWSGRISCCSVQRATQIFYCDMSPNKLLDIGLRLSGTLPTYMTGSYLLGSIICEYSELLYNRATIFTLKTFAKKSEKYYRLFVANREYLWDILIPIVCLHSLSRMELESYIFIMFLGLGLSISRNRYLFGIIMTSGYFSGYNLWHLLGVGSVLYTGISLREVDIFPEEYIEPKMVSSYLMTPPTVIHEEPMIMPMYEQTDDNIKNGNDKNTDNNDDNSNDDIDSNTDIDWDEKDDEWNKTEPESSFPIFVPSGRRISPSGRKYPTVSAPPSLSSSPIIIGNSLNDIHEDYRRTPSSQQLYLSLDKLQRKHPLVIQSDNEEVESEEVDTNKTTTRKDKGNTEELKKQFHNLYPESQGIIIMED